ncbi:unnamed protein product [Schistocephalus solidus]|uniref:GED domain-containing protein n=1 Tax=Schistocephalus solidus TaxID=70667 RepID=A0A183SXB6_SCHSO|nr:unnamed protein product [Schistocephalus solidus]
MAESLETQARREETIRMYDALKKALSIIGDVTTSTVSTPTPPPVNDDWMTQLSDNSILSLSTPTGPPPRSPGGTRRPPPQPPATPINRGTMPAPLRPTIPGQNSGTLPSPLIPHGLDKILTRNRKEKTSNTTGSRLGVESLFQMPVEEIEETVGIDFSGEVAQRDSSVIFTALLIHLIVQMDDCGVLEILGDMSLVPPLL